MDYNNRHVVVTGGTGALGAAVVARLVDAGATCHVPWVLPGEAGTFTLRDHAQVRLTGPVDLTDQGQVDAFYQGLPDLWASIHCAGGFTMSPMGESGAAEIESMLRMNALTAYLCSRAALLRMRARGGRGGGRMVNIAARPALEPRQGAGMVAYTMSKAAIAALTESLGQELADEDIWVNAVAPATLDTPGNRAAMPGADTRKWAPVEDVAEVIAFLASPSNRTVRGAVVPVYGRG
jgi:NAD(P)-dependent dehydrogenase (short-subunit alcohol dehydrogenase family)